MVTFIDFFSGIGGFHSGFEKAGMKCVGWCEFDKLPKFNNGRKYDENGKVIRGTGKMMFDWSEWKRDGKDIPKIHPTQKPVSVLKRLIEIFTDEGDVVIDPVAGSGSTLRACRDLGRNSYGFEVYKEFYTKAKEEMLAEKEEKQTDIFDYGVAK